MITLKDIPPFKLTPEQAEAAVCRMVEESAEEGVVYSLEPIQVSRIESFQQAFELNGEIWVIFFAKKEDWADIQDLRHLTVVAKTLSGLAVSHMKNASVSISRPDDNEFQVTLRSNKATLVVK